MSDLPYIPDAGDIVWAILNPRTGHEQSGRRPALVVSSRRLAERTSLSVICPITSKVKGLPLEVIMRGCLTQGAILPIHIRSIDFVARKVEFIERAPIDLVDETRDKAGVILGFPSGLSW